MEGRNETHGNDSCVRTSDEEDSDVSPSKRLASGEKKITDHDDEDAKENVHGSLASSVRVHGIADDDEELLVGGD